MLYTYYSKFYYRAAYFDMNRQFRTFRILILPPIAPLEPMYSRSHRKMCFSGGVRAGRQPPPTVALNKASPNKFRGFFFRTKFI